MHSAPDQEILKYQQYLIFHLLIFFLNYANVEIRLFDDLSMLIEKIVATCDYLHLFN